jgi:hypothetical protein
MEIYLEDNRPTLDEVCMEYEEAIEIFKSELDWAKQNRYPYVSENKVKAIKLAIKLLEQQPILEKDGTLIVTTEHYENVGRVLVQHGTTGTLFYQDYEPCEEREQGKCPFYAS